jgi:hypothetical protein
MVSEPSGRNESERRNGLENASQKSSSHRQGEGSMDRCNLADAAVFILAGF